MNEAVLKIEYLIIFSQYFGNFTQDFFVVWPRDYLCNVSKILAEFLIRYSTLKNPSFML